MLKKKLPSISFITTTYNADLTLFKRSLDSIKMQKYPKNLLEHIVVDGGSTNRTVAFAKKNNCRVIIRDDLTAEQEVRASIGIKAAKGDIYALIQSDNILTTTDWLEKIVEPFLKDKNIFCTYSAYNSFEDSMPITTRYCALFGATDPAFYYLGKSEKIPITQKKYNKGEIIDEYPNYYKVKFNTINLPTIGDNGHFIKRKVINKVNKSSKMYTHTDAIYELVEMGYSDFGVVKNSIIHMANPNILNLVKRRVEVKRKYSDERRGKRKYLVFNWQSRADRINLIKYILYSLSIILPIITSLKGYLKKRDTAWFLHPVICLLMTVGYGYSEASFHLDRMLSHEK